MIELNDNFSLADLGNVKKEAFEILYNKNRVSSWEGHTLKYGNVLRFSNVFRKTRNQITEALDNRLGK